MKAGYKYILTPTVASKKEKYLASMFTQIMASWPPPTIWYY